MYMSDGISENMKPVRDLAFMLYIPLDCAEEEEKKRDGKVQRERNEILADAGLPIKNYLVDPR